MNWQSSHCRFPWLAYVLAVGLTMVTLWVRLAWGSQAGDGPMMVLFIIPVMLSAYAGGLGPGLVATAAGALVADYYLMPPLHSLGIDGVNGVQWAAFSAVGVSVSLLLEKTRRSALVDQSELARERAILKSIMDSVPALIFSKDREHRFVRVNQEMATAVGRTREEIEGRTDAELGSPHAERFHRDEEEIFATGLPKRNLIERLTTQAGDRWLQTEKIPYRDPDGRIVGIVGFAVDITERLRAEEERTRLAAIVQGVSEACFALDREWRFTFVNERWETLFHLQRDEVIGRSFWSAFEHLRSTLVEENFRRVMDERVPVSFETFSRGAEQWLDVRLFPSGEGLAAFILDIHDRKKAEAAAAREKLFSDTMVDSMSGILYFFNEQGKYLRWNRALERVSGYSTEEVAGMHPLNFFRSEDAPLVMERIAEVFAQGESSVEAPFLAKDGSVKPYFFTGKRVLFDGATCLVGNGLDISERKRAEERLRESEERLRIVTENARVGLVIVNRERLYEYSNYTYAEMIGLPLTAIVGQPLPEVLAKLYEAQIRPQLDRAFAGERVMFEVLRPAAEGGRHYAIMYEPWKVDSVVALVVAVITDITDRKVAEAKIQQFNAELERRVVDRTEQLEAANSRLEGANKELESFSYSVSHDLRAPLRAIAGFSQALDESSGERLDETERGYLARVRAAAERMGHLIDDLLDLSRVSRSEMARRPVDLSGLARTILDELRGRAPARVVEIEIEEGLSIEGDPRLLRTMLENLLGNAWKFTGKKESAHIAFRCARSEPPCVTFVISDDGAGFDMRYAGKLFGAFQRLHALTEFPGTGIGLATVQRIIHRHGGRIWAESVVEAGANFFFELPAPSLNKTN